MTDKRPSRYKRSDNLHVRTVGFPLDVYARILEIAQREDRDVTSQIVRMLRESLDRYDKEKTPGNWMPTAPAAVAA